MPTNQDFGTVSVNAIRQFLKLAQALKLDTGRLCKAAGLSPDLTQEPGGEISGAAFQHLLTLLLDESRDPLLGLHVSDYVEPGSYNVLGYITMSCATLGEAVERIVPYERLVGDMGATRLLKAPHVYELQWRCAYPDARLRRHVIDNVFGSWITYARWLCDRPELRPLAVDLEHAPPSPELAGAYAERWQCPVRFSQPLNRVCFEPDLLKLPLRQPDPVLRETLEDHARGRIAARQSEQGFVIQVQHLIYQHLRRGLTRQDLIADALAVTPRTLQRKLVAAGVSYQDLLDKMREQLARDYLADPTMPLNEIGLKLGFAESRSFYRSFKRWTGTTPARYRAVQIAK